VIYPFSRSAADATAAAATTAAATAAAATEAAAHAYVSHVRLTGSISYTLLNTTVSTLRLSMGLAPDPTVTVDLPPNIHPSLLAVTNGMKDSVNEVYQHRQITGNSRLSPQDGQLCKVTAGQLGPGYSCATLVSTGETNSGPPKQPQSNRPPTTVLQYKAQMHASWRAPHARLRIRTLINCAVLSSTAEATSTRYDLPRTNPIGIPIKTLFVTTPAPLQHCKKKACQRPQTNSHTTLYTSKPMLAATNTHDADALQDGGSESSSTLS
jgi:hypothetical protein